MNFSWGCIFAIRSDVSPIHHPMLNWILPSWKVLHRLCFKPSYPCCDPKLFTMISCRPVRRCWRCSTCSFLTCRDSPGPSVTADEARQIVELTLSVHLRAESAIIACNDRYVYVYEKTSNSGILMCERAAAGRINSPHRSSCRTTATHRVTQILARISGSTTGT